MVIDRVRSVIAVTLVSALTFMMIPTPLLATDFGTLSGRVVTIDRQAFAETVTIVLVNPETMEEVRSSPTNAEGSFRFDAPAGRYVVLAETEAGAYLASESFTVVAGVNPEILLTLDSTLQPTADLGQQGTGLATWAKWLIVGGIVVGAALVIDSATEDTEAPGSPF